MSDILKKTTENKCPHCKKVIHLKTVTFDIPESWTKIAKILIDKN